MEHYAAGMEDSWTYGQHFKLYVNTNGNLVNLQGCIIEYDEYSVSPFDRRTIYSFGIPYEGVGADEGHYEAGGYWEDSYLYNYYGYNYQANLGHKPGFSGNKMFDATIDILTEWNELYTEGEFTFKEWLKEVKNWNKLLKQKKANFSIKELTDNELHLNAGYYSGYNPMDIIDYGEENEQNIKV